MIRVAAAYLVAGWLLIEASSVLLEAFEAPAWIPRAVAILLALGFPLALFFSWAFEITPEGVKREEEVDRSRSITDVTAKRLDIITIAMLLITVAFVAYTRFMVPAPMSAVVPVVTAAQGNSIAVLPFTNMSADEDNVYFSDGISEEILNVLARVPELKVAARTSSFQFRGDEHDIPVIAQQLGVATVLEGSVRKQGQRVRITAQLIDAASGFHLWSDTYDRELTDIFAIQDEIAGAIAGALQLQLDVEVATDIGTEDLEAYDLYLRGIHHWRLRTQGDILAAIELFQRARDRDPAFARAYEGLALAYSIADTYTRIPIAVASPLARANALHALALDPTSSDAYAVLGNDPEQWPPSPTSVALLERAVALNPNNGNAIGWLGLMKLQTGDIAGAIEAHQRALETDPLLSLLYGNLGFLYVADQRVEDAERVLAELRQVNPDDTWLPSLRLQIAVARDDRPALVEVLDDYADVKGTAAARAFGDRLIAAIVDGVDTDAVLEELGAASLRDFRDPESRQFMWSVDIMLLLNHMDRPDLAVQQLDTLAASRSLDAMWGTYTELFAPMRCFPRYRELMRELGLEAAVASWDCG